MTCPLFSMNDRRIRENKSLKAIQNLVFGMVHYTLHIMESLSVERGQDARGTVAWPFSSLSYFTLSTGTWSIGDWWIGCHPWRTWPDYK